MRSIDLSPGSYGAEYGRGLGGLVRIDLAPLSKDGVHGNVAADVLDGSGLVSAAITPRLRLALAGRISYLDQALPLVTSADVGDFVPIPKYDDYQARATWSLRPDEELALTFLASDDHLRRAIPSDDPTEIRSENTDTDWKRVILRYTRLLPDGASVVVTPSFGYDTTDLREQFGATPVNLKTRTYQYGLRSSYRRRVAPSTTLSFGIDLQARSSTLDRSGSLTLPAREGDVTVFGQPPRNDIAVDHWNTLVIDTAPFVNAEINLGRLSLVPGVRFEPVLVEGSPVLPASGTTPPRGYASFSLPINPGAEGFRVSAQPAAGGVVAGDAAADTDRGRRDLWSGARPAGLEPRVRHPGIRLSRAAHMSGGFRSSCGRRWRSRRSGFAR